LEASSTNKNWFSSIFLSAFKKFLVINCFTLLYLFSAVPPHKSIKISRTKLMNYLLNIAKNKLQVKVLESLENIVAVIFGGFRKVLSD